MSSYISIFDLFSVGIGPSSSHSVGPMKAAKIFLGALEKEKLATRIHNIQINLYGSLALTGKGHGTDRALVLGLLGYTPESIDPDQVEAILANVDSAKQISVDEF